MSQISISRNLHDSHAERIILSCLLHDLDATAAALITVRFQTSDLYDDLHRKTYETLMYVMYGGCSGQSALELYEELVRRKWWLGLARRRDAFLWIADLWFHDCWMKDMRKWSREIHLPFHPWAAVTAAAKVTHLSRRRQAIHAAQELIRDAIDPVGGADELSDRMDTLDGYR